MPNVFVGAFTASYGSVYVCAAALLFPVPIGNEIEVLIMHAIYRMGFFLQHFPNTFIGKWKQFRIRKQIRSFLK